MSKLLSLFFVCQKSQEVKDEPASSPSLLFRVAYRTIVPKNRWRKQNFPVFMTGMSDGFIEKYYDD